MTHRVSIVLTGPGDDPISKLIDIATKRRGWAHCFIDPGWNAPGDPVVIDISRQEGVQFSTWTAATSNRATRRINLDPIAGIHVLDRLWPCIGQRYSMAALVLQPLQSRILRGTYCSTIVADCLPPRLRGQLPTCPSPSDLLELERLCAPCSS